MNSCIHSIDMRVPYWAPGTVLGTEDAAVSTIEKKFWLYGAYLLVGGDTHTQTECLPLTVMLRWATWTIVALPMTSASDSKSFVHWYSTNTSPLIVSDLSKRLCFPEHCLPCQGPEGIFLHKHKHRILLSHFLSYPVPCRMAVCTLASRTSDEVGGNWGKESIA